MIEEVLARIEDLSLKIVIGGADPADAVAALALIENIARGAGRTPAAEAARKLAMQTSEAAQTGSASDLEKILGTGLENLRRVVQGAAPASTSSLAEDPELLRDFVNEAAEHLASIESEVLLLERDPTAADPLHAAFRSFHTIKGLAGFLELTDIREVSHEVETLLDRARNGQLAVTPAVIDVVLESADYLKRAISWVNARLNGEAGAPPEFTSVLRKVGEVLASPADESETAEIAPTESPVSRTPEILPKAVSLVSVPRSSAEALELEKVPADGNAGERREIVKAAAERHRRNCDVHGARGRHQARLHDGHGGRTGDRTIAARARPRAGPFRRRSAAQYAATRQDHGRGAAHGDEPAHDAGAEFVYAHDAAGARPGAQERKTRSPGTLGRGNRVG